MLTGIYLSDHLIEPVKNTVVFCWSIVQVHIAGSVRMLYKILL